MEVQNTPNNSKVLSSCPNTSSNPTPITPKEQTLQNTLLRKRAAPNNSKSEDSIKSTGKLTGRWRKDEHERFLEGILRFQLH